MMSCIAPSTFTDWMSLSQTVVLFLTGIIILWYTLETRWLRQLGDRQANIAQQQADTAQKQAEVASRQADLSTRQFDLSEKTASVATDQLEITRLVYQDMQVERERASYPFFLITSIPRGGETYTLKIENMGAAIYDVTVEASPAVIKMPGIIQRYLAKEKEVSWSFTAPNPLPEEWELSVRYFTLLHKKSGNRYSVIRNFFKHLGPLS